MSAPSQHERSGHALSQAEVVHVVLVYSVFAAFWILLSDQALDLMIADATNRTLAGTIKGWLFVAVTAGLLYWLLRQPGPDEPRPGRRRHAGWAVVPISLVVLVAIFTIRAAYQSHQARGHAQILTVAELKAAQISQWLTERQADANELRTSSLVTERFMRWHAQGDAASGQLLRRRLEDFRRESRLDAVTLRDAEGRLLMHTGVPPQGANDALKPALKQALAQNAPIIAGPYRDEGGAAHLDFVAPLATPSGPPPLVVLHVNPRSWLYPTLKAWPVPSYSGETVLYRRDGDRVAYLSELRFRADAAARLRLPMSTPNLLAARVLTGPDRTGTVHEGNDYRGVAVVGAARAIPGTNWILSAEVDSAELNAEARRMAVWISLTAVLALFTAMTGLRMARQRQALVLADQTSHAQSERLRALRLLAAIADSSDDAIFAKDLEGRYLLFNKAAERFAGKPAEEVLGKDDFYLFAPDEARKLQETARQCIAERRSITQEETLFTPEGIRVFLATKGPLYDEHGQVIGVFGISRDVSQRKKAQEQLAEQMNRFRFILNHSTDGIVVIDQSHCIVEANQRFADMLGYRFEELFRLHTWDYEANLTEDQIRADFADLESMSRVFETRHRRKDGSLFDVEVSVSGTRWSGTQLALCICRNITERKQAQDALARQHRELRARNDELERFNRVTVGRELDMIALKREVNGLSRELGRTPPYDLSFVEPAGDLPAPPGKPRP